MQRFMEPKNNEQTVSGYNDSERSTGLWNIGMGSGQQREKRLGNYTVVQILSVVMGIRKNSGWEENKKTDQQALCRASV